MRYVLLFCFSILLNGARAEDVFDMTSAVLATYKIANEGSTSTAFVVRTTATGEPAKYVLCTAAHTFERMRGDECKLVLRAPKPEGTYTRQEIALPIRKEGKSLWTRHKDADIAVMAYTPPAGFENHAIPLELLASDADFKECIPAGAYVRLLCYPAQFEANGAGFPILRHGVIASFPLAPAALQKTFMIDFTTFAGDSGGPVFSMVEGEAGKPSTARLMLVGVVISQQWSDERVKVSDREDRVIRHPFGLGTAVNSHLLRELIGQVKKK